LKLAAPILHVGSPGDDGGIGHDSEAIHEHYVNVGRDALQKAAAVFPSI
jgi:hypothetical protein